MRLMLYVADISSFARLRGGRLGAPTRASRGWNRYPTSGLPPWVSTSDNFLRPETLREANDIVSNAISRLPTFRHYDICGVVHSSSDGQKFETAVRTFTPRHSSNISD